MRRRPLLLLAFAFGCYLSSVTTGHTAQLKVFASVALKSILDPLSQAYEKKTGDNLIITYDVGTELKKRIMQDENVDVVIITERMISDLQKQNKVAAGGAAIAVAEVSVAAKAGAPKPDISSVQTLEQALLAAKSIAYSSPTDGGPGGGISMKSMKRLGIAMQIMEKTVLVPGGHAAVAVAKGEAELAIAQTSEIVPVPGVQLIGPLPGDLASPTVFSAGICSKSTSAESATALIDFLTGPEAAGPLKAAGFEPGNMQVRR
jgi:molybdate transport system substrate-binding protein